MSILDRFAAFARALSEERRSEIEDVLASIMAANEHSRFTGDELADIDRRLAEADPQYASEEEVAAVFERITHG